MVDSCYEAGIDVIPSTRGKERACAAYNSLIYLAWNPVPPD